MEHSKSKKIKILILIKIFLFNLFLIGFILNLIAYVNSYWIVSGETYIIGLHDYCKRFNQFEIESTSFSFNKSNVISLKKVFKCINWNSINRPRFLKFSLGFYTSAIFLHLITLIILITFISVNILFNNKTNVNEIYDNQSGNSNFYKRKLIAYISLSAVGFLIVSLYGSTIIIFGVNYYYDAKQKQQEFSWCFWTHLCGFILTLIPICFFFIYTVYFKMLNIKSTVTDKLSQASFNEFNDFNVPTTSFNPLFITNQSTNEYQNIFELDMTQVQKLKREHNYNDLSLKRNAPTVYPQVYPVSKKKKKLNHAKMISLPFGSLSGVYLKN